MEISKRTSSGRVTLRTGSEGPRHDPYAYRELSVVRGKRTIVLHEGLGEWVKADKPKLYVQASNACPQDNPRRIFEALVGVSVNALEKALNRVACSCGSKRFHSESGYPGETFTVCSGCGNICGSSFNRSAIE